MRILIFALLALFNAHFTASAAGFLSAGIIGQMNAKTYGIETFGHKDKKVILLQQLVARDSLSGNPGWIVLDIYIVPIDTNVIFRVCTHNGVLDEEIIGLYTYTPHGVTFLRANRALGRFEKPEFSNYDCSANDHYD